MRRLIIGAAAIAALVAGAAPAAAKDWSAPILLEPTPPGFEVPEGPVSVAANARGDAIAVWVRQRDSDQGTTCCDDERVIASYRPAGGVFGKPETISRLGDEATSPDVAVDAAGNAFVAWVVNDVRADLEITAGGVGVATRRARARRFDRPRLVSKALGSGVHVTAGVEGQAVVAWERLSRLAPHDLSYPRQVMAAVQSGPGRFTRPVAVSRPNSATDLGDGVRLPLEMHVSAVADPSGATYLAWSRDDGSAARCCRALEVSRRRAGRAFERPSAASGPFPAEPEDRPVPFFASRPADALLAWMDGATLVSREWPAGQPLGPVTRFDLPRSGGLEALGIAADGTATALIGLVSATDDQLGFTLSATRRPPGGAFGPLEEFARSGSEASLLVDRSGLAHAIWTRFTKLRCYRSDCTPAGPRIDAADAAATGGFANVRSIASRDNGEGPSIAAAHGGAIAGWLGDHGPWVAALGPRIGRAPVRHAVRGPLVGRFAKRGRRTFTFRLSKPARVVIDITRVEGVDEEIRRIGQAAVNAGRGPGRLILPRRIKPLRGRSYEATLIAEDAAGHDSVSIAPVYFSGD